MGNGAWTFDSFVQLIEVLVSIPYGKWSLYIKDPSQK